MIRIEIREISNGYIVERTDNYQDAKTVSAPTIEDALAAAKEMHGEVIVARAAMQGVAALG